jgi:hypothetical protein
MEQRTTCELYGMKEFTCADSLEDEVDSLSLIHAIGQRGLYCPGTAENTTTRTII